MIEAWYDDAWAVELESWEELIGLLRGDWDRVEHPPLGLSLERADGLLAFDLHGRWHARHRRGLHRLGFRALSDSRIWRWDVEPPLRSTDLSLFASRFESIFEATPPSAAGEARVLRMRMSLARDHLVREQALRVLRDVFACEAGDVGVLLVREDDEWEDEEDDASPAGG